MPRFDWWNEETARSLETIVAMNLVLFLESRAPRPERLSKDDASTRAEHLSKPQPLSKDAEPAEPSSKPRMNHYTFMPILDGESEI
jgi:hypothetical protein